MEVDPVSHAKNRAEQTVAATSTPVQLGCSGGGHGPLLAK
jgi:hypothetical protein